MIIRNKQDLRKCVKQCVRRAPVIETHAAQAMIAGEYGVAANLQSWTCAIESLQESFELACVGSPVAKKTVALLAALDALQLPVHDLDKAECIIKGYDQNTYLSAILDAMCARRLIMYADASALENLEVSDERLVPGIMIEPQLFAPGRYGVDYAAAAEQIAHWIHELNVRDIAMAGFSLDFFKYCLIPVCEDHDVVLHAHIDSQEQLKALFDVIREHQDIRMIVGAQEDLERMLIDMAAQQPNILIQLRCTENIPYALRVLGTRFLPYTSNALLPEEMLGGWVLAKEALWQALYDAYLPLARVGYELTRERIEADVEMLLCGNFERIHEI